MNRSPQITASKTCRPSKVNESPIVTPAALVALAPAPQKQDTLRDKLNRRLLIVWDDLERALEDVPFIHDIYNSKATLSGYRTLLSHLRNPVVKSTNCVACAGHTPLDVTLLEADYVACGGDLEQWQQRQVNLDCETPARFLQNNAIQPAPSDLLGALFIIEGLHHYLAPHWAGLLQSTLQLRPDQLSFLTSHCDNSDLVRLDCRMGSLSLTEARSEQIVNTARTTADLYRTQLALMESEA